MLATRRRFLKAGAAAATVAVAAVAADAIMKANDPELVQIEIPLARWPEAWDGFRIAQLSDFHYDDYFSAVPLGRAVQAINRLKPDLVVLTGDFVTVPIFADGRRIRRQAAAAIEPCVKLLLQLRARLGSLAILGNHDVSSDPQWIVETMERQGIPVLRNRSIPFAQDGARFWLCGLDDVLEGTADLHLALQKVPRNEPVVLLAHEPDCADEVAKLPVDLQLSGHSHGGQVRFPLIGPLYLPPLGRKYPWGLRRVGPLTLYTNAGIGTIRVAVRLNCPPEITLFTLRAARTAG